MSTQVANHVSHSVVGLVFQVGDTEKFHQAHGLESLELFVRVSQQDPCLTNREENGDKGLEQPELNVKLMDIVRLDSTDLTHKQA